MPACNKTDSTTWDETIQGEIEKSDVMIVLVSVDSLATDYITEREIPVALARNKRVIPIILTDCRWAKTVLGSLNALPEKGKPLNEWGNRPKAWRTVADGLAEVFTELQNEVRRDAGRRSDRLRPPH